MIAVTQHTNLEDWLTAVGLSMMNYNSTFFFFFLNNKVKENLRNKKEITGRSGRKEATCVNLRLICQMRHLFMAAKPRLDFDLDRMHLTCYSVCSVRFQYKMLNCRSERESLVLARLQA